MLGIATSFFICEQQAGHVGRALHSSANKQTLIGDFEHDGDHYPYADDKQQEGNIVGQTGFARQCKAAGIGK